LITEYKMIKTIEALIIVLILGGCSSVPTIEQNRSSVFGLIPFSEEVSSDLEIGKDINFHFLSVLQNEGITTVALNNELPINYQMAESPEVTIEPVGEDVVKKQLQELSTTRKMEGIIFGHIMQDLVTDMVYVIVRVYLVSDPEQYQTFGHRDAMGIKAQNVNPKIVKARLAQIGKQIKLWLKKQQSQTSQSSPPQSQPQQPAVPLVQPPQSQQPQEPADIVEKLGGSEPSHGKQQPSDDMVDLLGGE